MLNIFVEGNPGTNLVFIRYLG